MILRKKRNQDNRNMHKHWLGNIMKTAQTARNMEENMKLQEIVANRCGKEISQCTNEELYYALLEMTKGMAEEKVSNQENVNYITFPLSS